MEELNSGAGHGQAGKQQEARVVGQPRDNEGKLLEATANNEVLMKRSDITRTERRQERCFPFIWKGPMCEPGLCDPHTH